MFKEKLKQVQKFESQAADLAKKANEKSAIIIAKAKEEAAVIEQRAESEAAAGVSEVRQAIDKEIFDEAARITEASGSAIEELRQRSAAAIDNAAAEIVRRVTQGSVV